MKNKRILALLALTISASVFMSACSFFGGDEPEESVAVTVTPTPVATETPTPEPTIAPNVQSTTYTSADKTMAINLPDATWSNKSDGAGKHSGPSWTGGRYHVFYSDSYHRRYGSISGTGRRRQDSGNRF